MDEAELTRKAVEEIMREMQMEKDRSQMPQIQERKKNPLGPKPNKDFLGRTINSVMTHNKRQHDQNYKNCQRKLKDLDNDKHDDTLARCKRHKYRGHRKERRKRKCSQSSQSSSDSDSSSTSSSEDEKYRKKSKKLKKRKKKKCEKQISSRESSPTTLSSTSCSSFKSSSSECSHEEGNGKKKRKYKKHKNKKHLNIETAQEDYYSELYAAEPMDGNLGLYMNPNMALAAAMAYNHMNNLLQTPTNQPPTTDILKDELAASEENEEQKVDIPSDLSLTYHSSDSGELNVTLNSSSAEEDENGILTFNLSSDEDKGKTSLGKKKCLASARELMRNRKKKISHTSASDDDDDVESVHSHISLEESDVSLGNSANIVHVSILSSSSFDSDCQEVKVEENMTKIAEINSVRETLAIQKEEVESTEPPGEQFKEKLIEITITNEQKDETIDTIDEIYKESAGTTQLMEKDDAEADKHRKENEELSIVKTQNSTEKPKDSMEIHLESTFTNNEENDNAKFELSQNTVSSCPTVAKKDIEVGNCAENEGQSSPEEARIPRDSDCTLQEDDILNDSSITIKCSSEEVKNTNENVSLISVEKNPIKDDNVVEGETMMKTVKRENFNFEQTSDEHNISNSREDDLKSLKPTLALEKDERRHMEKNSCKKEVENVKDDENITTTDEENINKQTENIVEDAAINPEYVKDENAQKCYTINEEYVVDLTED
ncbi:serine-rich adhesin for platelets [Stomoxys calcitrans]|uniref:serine-rich adhesin for platelets n=1 Tax=Stomoxys calcitrans TaxID=35570 RepID=UPI0027E32204|nr:serine-rich adhesin for platelets [Stomoxys calcitrans]